MKVLIRAIQNVLFMHLSYYVKSYGHLCQNLAYFAMYFHQIWSCHVTHIANFEIFYFGLVLHLILISSGKFSTSEVISSNPHWRTPLVFLRLRHKLTLLAGSFSENKCFLKVSSFEFISTQAITSK